MRRIIPTDWQTQVKIFEKYGCTFKRQKGDHLIYHHPRAKRAIVIPRYKEVSISIIKNNMKTVWIPSERYTGADADEALRRATRVFDAIETLLATEYDVQRRTKVE